MSVHANPILGTETLGNIKQSPLLSQLASVTDHFLKESVGGGLGISSIYLNEYEALLIEFLGNY